MKYIFVVLILFFMQHNAYAWAYHSVYNLQGKKVYERNDVSIDYYSENLLILKDNKGYYFCFTNGSRSKYYSFLKKLPMSKIYFIASTPEMGEKAQILNNKGQVVIHYKNNYGWDYIYTPDDKIIVYDEKENVPYLIDESGKKLRISQQCFEKEQALNEKRKDAFRKNYFVFEENGLWGIKDYSGKLILKPTFKKPIKVDYNYVFEIDY